MERTSTLTSPDGTRLFYREWAAVPARAALFLVHGLGEHSGRYAALARHLNTLGITVRVHDHRGHGRSDGARAALVGRDDLVADLKCVFDDFARAQGATPFLFGHSLGGLVAAQFATRRCSALRGLLLSSPALAVKLSGPQRVLLAVTAGLLPKLALANGLDVTRISHDPEVITAYRTDPLIHDRITPGLVRTMLDALPGVMAHASTLDIPVLVQAAGDDHLVVAAGAREFFARLPPGRGTLHWYEGAYHEIFNETAAWRDRALADLTHWLEAQLAGPPAEPRTRVAPDRGTDIRPAS